MKKIKFTNKNLRFFVSFFIYGFVIFFLFSFLFKISNKDENKHNIVTSKNKKENKKENKNKIDISKLDFEIKVGNPKKVISDKEIMDTLLKSEDEDIKYILKNKDKLDDSYFRLLYNNISAKFFIKDLLENKSIDYYIGESVPFKRKIPYYLQWDRRWGNKVYGKFNIATGGCAPTSMAMVISGLLKDHNITPIDLAKYQDYVDDFGTDWGYFINVANFYGIYGRVINKDKELYKEELKKSHPIILNVKPGDFTSVGHYIVLVDVDKEGMFIVNDPNSPKNSNCKWSFERLSPQIKQSWVFSKKE